MITTDEVAQLFRDAAKESGFEGQRSSWGMQGDGVSWLVALDVNRRNSRVGVEVGVEALGHRSPRRPSDCSILMHLENLPSLADVRLLETSSLNVDMTLEDRRPIIRFAMHELGTTMKLTNSVPKLRELYEAGGLKSAFIHKDARSLLAGPA